VIADGTVVDRYRVERELGRGGMAVVYLVRHKVLDTPKAMKIMQISAPGLIERFIAEGRVQARLEHPGIVSVSDVIEVDGKPALIMEYVRGPTLADVLLRYPLNLAHMDDLAEQMFVALEFAHAQGVIHRDLKPDNVLLALRDDGVQVKIADFGLAKIMDEALGSGGMTRAGSGMGTPAYMAPEQHRDASRVDVRADVFSLGATLYELLTGARPFRDDEASYHDAMMAGQYRPLPDINPSTPGRWVTAIHAALAADREGRPASIADMHRLWRGATPAPVAAWEPAHVAQLLPLIGEGEAQPVERTRPVPAASQTGRPASPTSSALSFAPSPRRSLVIPLVVAAAGLAVCTGGWALSRPSTAAKADVPITAPERSLPATTPAVVPPSGHPDPATPPAASIPPSVPDSDGPRPETRGKPPKSDHPPATRPGPPADRPARETLLRVRGADRWYLLDDHGVRHDGGDVPRGSYSLFVAFQGDDSAHPVLDLSLEGPRTITCNPAMRTCR
jgi:serine/threonine protein kinase